MSLYKVCYPNKTSHDKAIKAGIGHFISVDDLEELSNKTGLSYAYLRLKAYRSKGLTDIIDVERKNVKEVHLAIKGKLFNGVDRDIDIRASQDQFTAMGLHHKELELTGLDKMERATNIGYVMFAAMDLMSRFRALVDIDICYLEDSL
jgi:hypothetical protein